MAPVITLITSNQQKAQEIKAAMRSYSIVLRHQTIDIPEIKDLNIETVVRAKADQAYAQLRRPILVDDTGIFFTTYKDFPGAYSKFAFRTLGFKGLFLLIKPGARAYFCSYLAYKSSASAPVRVFRGICRGRLIRQVRGKRKAKMPYDNIFIPDGDHLTFAQMSIAEKQRYDHRSKAVRQFARYFMKKYSVVAL